MLCYFVCVCVFVFCVVSSSQNKLKNFPKTYSFLIEKNFKSPLINSKFYESGATQQALLSDSLLYGDQCYVTCSIDPMDF